LHIAFNLALCFRERRPIKAKGHAEISANQTAHAGVINAQDREFYTTFYTSPVHNGV